MSDEESSGGRDAGCLGPVIAFGLSWYTNHAFWWAVLHFFCGWLYVLYWIVRNL